MRSTNITTPVIVAAVCVACVAAIRAGAVQGAPGATGGVAVVNIEFVFNALDEQKAREVELKAYVDSRSGEINKMTAQIEQLGQDISLLPEGSPERDQKLEERAILVLQQRGYADILGVRYDERTANVFKNLFNKIRASAERVANQRGFSIVLSNDSMVDIAFNADTQNKEGAVKAQMIQRRVLFANPGVDISEQVLQDLNNNWKAGR